MSNTMDTSTTPSSWKELWNRLAGLPLLFWVILGTLPVFLAFQIRPMFFNARSALQYPVDYIMQINPIGHDLRVLLDTAEYWFTYKQPVEIVYTPLIIYLSSPLLRMGYPSAFYLTTMVTLISYIVLGFLAGQFSESRNHPVITFIVTLSFFSYGLQFELERGQMYTLSLMLCLLAVHLFHKQPRLRLLAYALFLVSIQLKFYPALLVVFFVDDWRNWRANLLRFGALGLASVLLLFLMGPSYFSTFFSHMGDVLQRAQSIWIGNHSIAAFAAQLSGMGIAKLGEGAVEWTASHVVLISNILYGYFLACFTAILLLAWRRNRKGIHANLLLACVIGAMTLPYINHDYTLPLLTAPFALAVSTWRPKNYPWPSIFTNLLTAVASSAYALTLLPSTDKPAYFENALPALFAILTIATLLTLAEQGQPVQVTEQGSSHAT